jgi:hypothetical protein
MLPDPHPVHIYVGPWNAFDLWCGSLTRPRRPLPVDDLTTALYFQSLMNNASSFLTIRSASASIAFSHKINLFTSHPTMAPEVCMVRTAVAKKLCLSAKRVKEPLIWFQSVDFEIKAIVTLLLRLWPSFYSMLCVVMVMLVDSSGNIINMNQILALSKIPLRYEKTHNFDKGIK